MLPVIVIPAYNRPQSLQRLLTSLQKSHIPPGVKLVISLDSGGEQANAVRETAARFKWPFGEKEIIQHPVNLGLIGNIFFCGDLTETYGAIILLEDDLVVSPVFYAYAQQALDYYASDDTIAAISLNTPWFNGYTHLPFVPWLDESDVFFMQVAWFQGQAYTARQWRAFREWLNHDPPRQKKPRQPIHEVFDSFPESDWFPLAMRYLVNNGRYFVFPRASLTVNFGEAGTHFQQNTRFFQVPLQTRQSKYRFKSWLESTAVYDSFQEMLPDRLNKLTDGLHHFEYTVDLNGTKSRANLPTPYVITTRPARPAIASFGLVRWPLVANIVENIPGSGIVLAKTDDLDFGRWADWALQKKNHDYFGRGYRVSWRQRLLWWLAAKRIR